MLHYSCDLCKRPIDTHTDVHHVVKIEVFPAVEDPAQHSCCEAESAADEADHLEEMQELLERLDDDELPGCFNDGVSSMRFDLCDACRSSGRADSSRSAGGKQHDFSNN